MTKYFFNWNDLLLKSKKDYDLIIILTYASTIGYNKKIANNSYSLLNTLNLKKIPINKNYLKLSKNFEIISLYKVTEPQSYFKNKVFLTANVNTLHKINYLKLLSYRNIENNNNYIDKDMLTTIEIKELINNPFINITEDKIYFIFE